MQKNTRFIPELEGLRGIAALAVAVCHHIATYCLSGDCAYWMQPFPKEGWDGKLFTIITMFFNANLAVVLFFVLSGFVLSASLASSQGAMGARGIAGYYVKRVFRIYPAHLVALIAMTALLLAIPFAQGGNYSDFFTSVYSIKISAWSFIKNAALYNTTINPVTWTLPVEIIGSFFIPLFLLSNRWQLPGKLVVLAVLIAISWRFQQVLPVKYLFCFYLGMILKDIMAALQLQRSLPLLYGGLAVSAFSRLLSTWDSGAYINDLLCALASVMIISAILLKSNDVIFKFFDNGIIKKLGQRSYSFYIIHLSIMSPIVVLLTRMGLGGINGVVANLVVTVVGITCSYYISGLLFTYVEKPFIKLGKAFTGRLSIG
ncbi:MAG: acyltransferase [Bacteroidetes bacterium]|nr:acyltransferase [Bacteroidota bacterium]